MEMRIGARNKGGYLTGETKKPDPTDPRREAWITENHRVKSSDDHIFLSGLDPVFDQVKGEILRKEPKLELEHAYAAVRREYSQKQVMDGGHSGGPLMVSESAAMMAGHRRSGEQGSGVCREHCQQQVMEANHRGGTPGFTEIVLTEIVGCPKQCCCPK